MFDPFTIRIIAGTANKLYNVGLRNKNANKIRVLHFAEFCDRVASILQLALEELKKEIPYDFSAIGAQLKAWSSSGNNSDSDLKEQRDELCQSLCALASRMMIVDASTLSEQARNRMQEQLRLIHGKIKGLSDVLRFETQIPFYGAPNEASRGLGFGRVMEWAAGSTSVAAAAIFSGALAEGAKHVPFVGPTLAGWINGTQDGDDSSNA